MRILKYKLEVDSEQTILLPAGSRILWVAVKDNEPCIWATDPNNYETERPRKIITRGTGEHFDLEAADRYIGSYQKVFEGGFVFVGHVFEHGGFDISL